jgi:hypothetical protein
MTSKQVAELREALEAMRADYKPIGNLTQVSYGGMTWYVRLGAQGFHVEVITPMTMEQVLRTIFANATLPVPARYEVDATGDVEVTCSACGLTCTYSEAPAPSYCQRCGKALSYETEDCCVDVTGPEDVTIRDIVAAWLARHGFNGLVNADAGCGCDLDDLMACDAPHETHCLPAYRHDCATCDGGCPLAVDAKPGEYMMDGSRDACERKEQVCE